MGQLKLEFTKSTQAIMDTDSMDSNSMDADGLRGFSASSNRQGMLTMSYILLAACLVGSTGCGSGNELGRLSVSGKITLDDKPLDSGSIDFSPHNRQGVSAGGVVSKEGSYSIAAAKGLPPGQYVVHVFSSVVKASSPNKESAHSFESLAGQVGVDRIPEEFNNGEQIVEVTLEGPNIFDFDIHTKK